MCFAVGGESVWILPVFFRSAHTVSYNRSFGSDWEAQTATDTGTRTRTQAQTKAKKDYSSSILSNKCAVRNLLRCFWCERKQIHPVLTYTHTPNNINSTQFKLWKQNEMQTTPTTGPIFYCCCCFILHERFLSDALCMCLLWMGILFHVKSQRYALLCASNRFYLYQGLYLLISPASSTIFAAPWNHFTSPFFIYRYFSHSRSH